MPAPSKKGGRYTINPRSNNKGRNYTINPRHGNKGRNYTIDPRYGNKGGSKITGPFVPKPGEEGKPSLPGSIVTKPGSKDKPWFTGPFVPKPGEGGNPSLPGSIVTQPGSKDKPWFTGPFVPKPGEEGKPSLPGSIVTQPGSKDKPWFTGPFVPKPGEEKITGPFVPMPGDVGLNPKDLKPLPKIDDLSKGLKDFWKKGDKGNKQDELLKVKDFANKCIGLPAPCGWWVDFCCWNWWDWCCYPGYWDCWHPCYWHYVHCPSQVVVVNGAQQVLEEVSYYLGISGSQIPNLGFGIQEVKTASPAERAGLKQGDIIVTVNGRQMTGEEVLATAMQQADGVLDLEVISQGIDAPKMVRVVAERIQTSSF